MCLGMLPGMALATDYVAEIVGGEQYTTLAEAITAANAAESAVTIKLLQDCETGSDYTISNPIVLTKAGSTLDLNGKTVTVTNNFSFVIQGNSIKVKDGTLASAANTNKRTGLNSYILVVNDCGGVELTNLTMTGGISIGGSQSDWGTVGSPKEGVTYTHGAGPATNVTIAGCNITSGDYYAVCSQMGSNATIVSGTYVSNQTAVNNGVGQLSPAVIYGRFVGNDGPEGYIYVAGGSFSGKIGSANEALVEISGGLFTVAPEGGLIKTGYKVVDNADATYKFAVRAKTYVAQIKDGAKYETLAQAVSAAQSGATVKLLENVDLAETLVIEKELTLDLDNKTISNTADIWVGSNWSLISVRKNGNLTITGNGTLDAKENDCYALDVCDGASLTIENGIYVGNVSAVYAYEGNVTINGGTFSIKQLAPNVDTDKYRYTLNCLDRAFTAKTASFTVNGGTFSNFDPSNNLAEGANTNFVAEGYTVTSSGNAYTVVPESTNVAAIGEVEYATLEAAFGAAQDGNTITLLADCSGNGIQVPQGKFANGLTVDFAGKTYTFTGNPVGSKGTEYIGFQLLKDNKITFQNGKIDVAKETTGTRKFLRVFQSYANVAFKNMKIDGTNLKGDNSACEFANGTVSITGDSSFTAKDGIASFNVDAWNGSYPDGAHVTVNTTGSVGTVNCYTEGTGTASSSSLYVVAGVSALTIEDGNTVAVTKAEATTLAAPAGYKWVDNGNGTSSLAKATYVAQIGETKYETLAAAINAATNGQTVTLLKDTNGGYDISGKSITLDLNDKTLTLGPSVGSTNTETSGIRVLAGAGLTIKNGNLYVSNIRNAKYEGNTEKPYAGYVKVALANYGTMVIEDVTMTQDANDSRLIWAVSNRGDLTIKGNTTIPNGTNSYTRDDNPTLTRAAINMTPYDYANVNATLTVNSAGVTVGDIVINDENNPKSHGYTQDRTISLNISAGQYGEIKQIKTYDGVTVTKSITGGTFDHNPSAYLAEDYAAIANGDGTWTVGEEVSSNPINVTTDSVDNSITPVITTTQDDDNTVKTVVITPTDVTTTGLDPVTTEIKQSVLAAAAANAATEPGEKKAVKIITGLSATASRTAQKAPQTIITDESGKTIFEAVAKGGQIRLDKKITGGIVSNSEVDTNATKADKAAAINYVDMRLQFEFQLPDGVSPSDSTTKWSWSVSYQEGNVTKTGKVNGVNYLPVTGTENRYTSNVVFTNVPMSLVESNFQATLTISYVKENVTYTITQSAEAPLAREIKDLVDYYDGYYSGGDATDTYFAELKTRISSLSQNS